MTTLYLCFYAGSALMRDISIGAAGLRRRCLLPAGIFEQVRFQRSGSLLLSFCDLAVFCIEIHPQILAGIVKLGFNSQIKAQPTVTSRSYAAVFVGSYLVELRLDQNLQAIRLDLHMSNTVAVLQQVSGHCRKGADL